MNILAFASGCTNYTGFGLKLANISFRSSGYINSEDHKWAMIPATDEPKANECKVQVHATHSVRCPLGLIARALSRKRRLLKLWIVWMGTKVSVDCSISSALYMFLHAVIYWWAPTIPSKQNGFWMVPVQCPLDGHWPASLEWTWHPNICPVTAH